MMSAHSSAPNYLSEDLHRLSSLVGYIGEFTRTNRDLQIWHGLKESDGVNRTTLTSNQYRLIDWLGYYRRINEATGRHTIQSLEVWAQILLKLAFTVEHFETLNEIHRRQYHAALTHPLMLEELCEVLRSLYDQFREWRPVTSSELSRLEMFEDNMTSLLHYVEHLP